MRHKFIALSKVLPNGAVAFCESCGVLNNSGAAGCLSDEPLPAGNHPDDNNFHRKIW